jgi:hypothetical protein
MPTTSIVLHGELSDLTARLGYGHSGLAAACDPGVRDAIAASCPSLLLLEVALSNSSTFSQIHKGLRQVRREATREGCEWPGPQEVLDALLAARRRDTASGWRTMAEIAGTLQCPDFARVAGPATELLDVAQAEFRRLGDGPSEYRAASVLLDLDRQ